jgi:hypothetical protein
MTKLLFNSNFVFLISARKAKKIGEVLYIIFSTSRILHNITSKLGSSGVSKIFVCSTGGPLNKKMYSTPALEQYLSIDTNFDQA